MNVLHVAAKKNYPNIVQMLIASSFPLDLQTSNGLTAVSIASKHGHLKVIKLLFKAGADINATDNDGIGPLYLAILHNHFKCAEYLVAHGAVFYYDKPVEKRDLSPIFLAIRKENTKLLEVFCDHG